FALRRRRRFHLFLRGGNFIDQFAQDDVAHGKTNGREAHGAVAELMDQVIITAAASERAQYATAIERFENDSGIIGDPTDDPEVDPHKIPQTADAESVEQPIA